MVVKEKNIPRFGRHIKGIHAVVGSKGKKHGLYGSKQNKHLPRHVFLLVVSK